MSKPQTKTINEQMTAIDNRPKVLWMGTVNLTHSGPHPFRIVLKQYENAVAVYFCEYATNKDALGNDIYRPADGVHIPIEFFMDVQEAFRVVEDME